MNINFDYELQPEVWGYKIYAYNSKLCQQLNRLMGYPYGRVDFVAENSEGIFKVDKARWQKAFRLLSKYEMNKG